MNDTTLSAADRIRAFSERVRAELSDLGEEEIEDLAGGLVADLTEQAADGGGEIALGDPVAYAQELRAAAGLPERTTAPPKPGLRERATAWRESTAAAVRGSRFGAWLLDLVIALRPVWWVLRGVGLYALLAGIVQFGPRTLIGQSGFGSHVLSWLLLLGVVLLSIQWGRGRWLPRNAFRHLRTVASVVAVLVLPFAAGQLATMVVNGENNAFAGDAEYQVPGGLLLDGTQVGNVFVYDRDGNLVDGAQLYTDKGTPLNLFGEQSRDMNDSAFWGWSGEDHVLVPFFDAQGRPVWNAFPLNTAPFDPGTGTADLDRTSVPQPPYLRAPERGLLSPAPTPVPTPTTTAAPTPGTTAEPTPAPTDGAPGETPGDEEPSS
ncbi:hypothetical protein PFZ55_49135 [Streptomyces sp. MS2A]|nr:hypothetical protein [Streptomyces sp. MS2A]